MDLQEFRKLLAGSDSLHVVVVVDDDAYEIDSVEEGVNSASQRELWIVTGDACD